MDSNLWWENANDDGWVNSILKFSVEARKWYLKTDVKVRLKQFILSYYDFDKVIYLWKRLQIVKKDFGEKTGSMIIKQAIKEIKSEFNDLEWEKTVIEKIKKGREELNDNFIEMI